jgi:hypothetical protein
MSTVLWSLSFMSLSSSPAKVEERGGKAHRGTSLLWQPDNKQKAAQLLSSFWLLIGYVPVKLP